MKPLRKPPYFLMLGSLTGLLCSSSSAAWFFTQPTGDISSALEVGSITISPTGLASYDSVPSPEGFGNIDGRGFDVAAQPFTFTFTTMGDEPISISPFVGTSGQPPAGSFGFLEVDLDPDGDNFYPDTIIFSFAYSQPISNRGVTSGGVGATVNSSDGLANLDSQSQWLDRTGFPIDVSTLALSGYPNTSPMGTLSISNTGIDGFSGIRNDGDTLTTLPFGSMDASEQLFSQSITVSNFNVGEGETFRLTFDGGVSVPEPSSSLLAVLAIAGFAGRRRR